MQKNLKFANTVVPPIIIFILAFFAFSSSDDLFGKGLIFSSLLIFYPLLFLLQSIFCSLLKSNIFITIGISSATFIIVMLVWLNSSAIGYIFLYLIVSFFGYGTTNFIKKLRIINNK